MPAARSTSGTRARTNGTNRVPASGPDLEQVLLGEVDDVGDPADLGPAGVEHPQPGQLAVVVLLLVVGTRGGVDVDHEHRAAQGLHGGAIGIAQEADQQPTAVVARRLDDELEAAALAAQHGARVKRRPGSSVRTSMPASPLMPWARPTMPTITSTVSLTVPPISPADLARSAHGVDVAVQHVRTPRTLLGSGAIDVERLSRW